MWMWILIVLIITKANGYSNGIVPTACGTMKPMHDNRDGVFYPPQTTEPPFRVSYKRGENGEPITVSLESTGNTKFMGFMLEAREQDDDTGSPVGKFILLDTNVNLLTCNGSAASAVTQENNQRKSLIRVKWSPGREDLHTVTFRATFVQDYDTFWEGVNITLSPPITTPSTTMSTPTEPSTTSATMPSPTEPNNNTSTTMPSPTEPNNNTRTTMSSPTESSTTTRNTTPSPTNQSNIETNLAQRVLVGSSVIRKSLNTFQTVPVPVVSQSLNKNIFHIVTVTVFSQCLNKVKCLKILCYVLFTLIEIAALVLFALGDSIHYVTLLTLVCVMIVMNLIQLVIVCLPLKKSHELYEILDITSKVCFVISEIVTSAVIFICVLEIKDCSLDQTECWPVIVMIAYTVWTCLFIILFILNTLINKEVSNNRKRGRQRKEKKLHKPTLIVSLFLIVGTVSFAVSVIVGIQLGH